MCPPFSPNISASQQRALLSRSVLAIRRRHVSAIWGSEDMVQPDTLEKSLRDEVARLGEELEQARVALEDAHEEILP